jgi:glucose-1-phosphate thymidylyltransferase
MGLGHAIWMTRALVKDASEIIIMLGDTIVDVDLNDLFAKEHSCLGTKKVSDPRQFGVVELSNDGFVKRVIEKPNIPKSNLAMVGLYKIKEVRALMDILDWNIKEEMRTHGEFQLTDALMGLIDQGVKLVPCDVNNWFDCGRKDILLETNATLLDRKPPSLDSLPETDNTIIIPPVSIGENCKICNSIIGPHVSIGSNATIDAAIISDSIIGSYSTITRFVLHHSLVGQDAAIRGMQRKLNIGDNTEIDLG